MRRLTAILAALVVPLLAAPAAGAATYTVDSAGDSGGTCGADPDPGTCTLRQAIEGADATGVADLIVFAPGVQGITVGSALSITGPGLVIDGGGVVSVSGNGSAGPVFSVGASDVRIERVAVRGSSADGIDVSGSAQRVVISQSPIFGNALEPIDLNPGANGNTPPPANLRVGQRQGDGSVLLLGRTTSAGTVEGFSGNPAGPAPTSFAGAFPAAGDFAGPLTGDLVGGGTVGATFTGPLGTSEFTTARVPNDIESPAIHRGRGLSQNEIIVYFSERVDPGSVQLEDIVFEMADVKRDVSTIAVAPDGTWVRLGSRETWEPGEAGLMRFSAAGVVSDAAGNVNVGTPRIRVAASPGDLRPPVASRVSLKPKSFCVVPKRCRRTGTVLKYRASEEGQLILSVRRGKKRIGSKPPRSASFGNNRVRFDGRVSSGRLRPGTYKLVISLEDNSGNVAARPPARTFRVKRPGRAPAKAKRKPRGRRR